MNAASGELLRKLAGGVSPVGANRADPPSGSTRTGATRGFQDRLARALAGSLRTALPVRVPIGIDGLAHADALDRLSEAADIAQGAGIDRALVVLGERTFRMDVAQRAVIDEPDRASTVVGGIDGLVRVESGPAAGRSGASGPARVVRNASLIDALAAVRPDID